MVMGLESVSARVERLARMIAVWNRVPPIEETVAKIDAISGKMVRDYAQDQAQAQAAMALYGPLGQAPDLGDLQQRLRA